MSCSNCSRVVSTIAASAHNSDGSKIAFRHVNLSLYSLVSFVTPEEKPTLIASNKLAAATWEGRKFKNSSSRCIYLHNLRLKSLIYFALTSFYIRSNPYIIWKRSRKGTGETKCIENSSVCNIYFSIFRSTAFSMTTPCVSLRSLSMMLKDGCIGCSSFAPRSRLMTARDVKQGGCFL